MLIGVLTQGLARDLSDATRFHALVYSFNTAGAFCGALAAGFWLVPTLGLVGVLVAMGVVNLVAGAVFLGIGYRPPPQLGGLASTEPGVKPSRPSRGRRAPRDFWLYAGVALLSGFAMITLQTVLIRLGAVSFGSSQFTFSMVVAVFVLCIALGSLAVSSLPRIPPGLLAWSLISR